jgi:hypothetical protein
MERERESEREGGEGGGERGEIEIPLIYNM